MKIFVKIVGMYTVLMNALALSGGVFRDNTDDPFPGFEAFDGGANNGKEIIEEEVITDPPAADPPANPDEPTEEEKAELARIAEEEAAKGGDKGTGDKGTKEENGEPGKEENKSGGKQEAKGGEEQPAAVKIGDKVLSDDDMAKVRAKMEQKFGKERLEKMDEDELLVWTKEYVNILEGSKSINAKFQEAKRESINLKTEQEKLAKEREDIQAKDAEANRVLAEIQKRRKELEGVMAKQPKDEFNDDEVADLRIEKKMAEQENKKLETQEKRLSDIVDKTKVEAEEIWYGMLINELQANIPDLQTAEAVPDILTKLEDLDEENAEQMEQAQVAQRVKMIFNGYLAEVAKNPDTKLTITKYYKSIKNNLPELKRSAAAQTAKERIEELKAGNMKEYYRKLAEKQAKQPPLPGGGGGSSHSTERIEEATDKTAQDHWKSLGYNFDTL